MSKNAIQQTSAALLSSVCRVFRGNEETVKMLMAALFADGHVLLEDVPGTGKTVLAKTLAKSAGLPYSRIQCTPDLMPSDITGSSVWLPSEQKFDYRAGPVLSSLVLVDELNRATPRTQSALLEAMAEAQVSVDGAIHTIDKPFFVIATENPVESEGTFPLPEAQKDRFMLTLSVGYPDAENEAAIITAQRASIHPVETVQPVVSKEDILACQQEAAEIHVDEAVLQYLLDLVAMTRKDDRLQCGVSPRGSIALYKAAQAWAAIEGRNYVTPEDVKLLALPAFRKRLILTPESILKGFSAEHIIQELLISVPIPSFKAHV